ncbi:hypothetical protein K3495_g2999 [Podosphaera aphanis]|nr:hypothetical protein K3495_g2999 [Podosphaera aphanis]
MSSKPLSCVLRRSHLPPVCKSHIQQQVRHATLIKRPYRPYTFTQLVTLSDGSTFLTRTTSPAPVYKSTKDSRNHPLWQPSSAALRNVEADEAGRLRAFRLRFGRGWDAEEASDEQDEDGKSNQDNLMDLISDLAPENEDKAK